MADWLIFVGLALYFVVALPFALRDQDRYLNERHSDGQDRG
jgi:hypothetical protein